MDVDQQICNKGANFSDREELLKQSNNTNISGRSLYQGCCRTVQTTTTTLRGDAHLQELQIKMAQGAKPGEGGELPGYKVSPPRSEGGVG
eukprot:705587-Amphidinium_carterae.1